MTDARAGQARDIPYAHRPRGPFGGFREHFVSI
jgi:hypothetical protein